MSERKILWADDEIELLRPHILILEKQGYSVTPVTNGEDALEQVQAEHYDLVLLDEMMPGKTGLDTLQLIKEQDPTLPCIMITKSEEESLMDQAIGGKIDDYLIKPVNPSQIIAACKKHIDSSRITQARMSQDYIQGLADISRRLSMGAEWEDFLQMHQQLCSWELALDENPGLGFGQTLEDQRRECNREFSRLVQNEYTDWITGEGGPVMSPGVVREYVVPLLRREEKVLFCVIDCMRLDHWMVLEKTLRNIFHVERKYHMSILPTATPYSRNSIFAGLYPLDISRSHPELWTRNMEDEGSTNRNERQFLDHQLAINGLDFKPGHKYIKVIDLQEAQNTLKKVDNLFNHRFVSMVWNFVDILAHSRSQNEIVREMVPNEAAYRSVVDSWFRHSPLYEIMRAFQDKGYHVVVTSDHGSIRVQRGARIYCDRDTTQGLRYKIGRNLRVDDEREAYVVPSPEAIRLPSSGGSQTLVFAPEDYILLYGNNYNKYFNHYKDSFQHGGISMEEMILPVALLEPRGR